MYTKIVCPKIIDIVKTLNEKNFLNYVRLVKKLYINL